MSPAPAASTDPPVARRADLVRIVEYVSECDVRAITPPMTYGMALATLRLAATATSIDRLDLVCEGTGRFRSWAI